MKKVALLSDRLNNGLPVWFVCLNFELCPEQLQQFKNNLNKPERKFLIYKSHYHASYSDYYTLNFVNSYKDVIHINSPYMFVEGDIDLHDILLFFGVELCITKKEFDDIDSLLVLLDQVVIVDNDIYELISHWLLL